MMELTKEHIKIIEQYLQNINFEYQDLKPEIIDHMATEIEETMQKRNLDFKDAFVLTRIKWNKNFRQINSYYFGNSNYAPKIVIEKAKLLYKPFYFGHLLSYFLPFIVLNNKKIDFIEDIHFALILTTYVASFLLIFVIYKTYRNSVKTVYSFIIKRNIFSQFFMIIFLIIFLYLVKSNLSIALISALTFTSFSKYFFYRKHLNELKKIKRVNRASA